MYLKKIGIFSDLILMSLRVSRLPQKCPFISWFIQIRIQTCHVFDMPCIRYTKLCSAVYFLAFTSCLLCKEIFYFPGSAERECCDFVHFDVYFVVMFLGSFRAPHWTGHITALKNKNKNSSALVLNAVSMVLKNHPNNDFFLCPN